MRIDTHHHLWRYRAEDFPWLGESLTMLKRDFLLAEFEDELRSGGIDGSVVVQAFHSLDETRWLLSVAESSTCILGVVGWVDLASPQAERQLEEMGPRLVGLRHIVKSEPRGFLAGPDFQRGLALLGPRNLSFDLLILPAQLAEATALVERFPGQRFILDHLANPKTPGVSLRQWRHDLARLAAHPRVWAKLSGFVTETFPSQWNAAEIRELLTVAFDLFGEDRLLLSSNWPVGNLAGSYSWTLGWTMDFLAPLSDTTRAKIFGSNALRAYGLRQKS